MDLHNLLTHKTPRDRVEFLIYEILDLIISPVFHLSLTGPESMSSQNDFNTIILEMDGRYSDSKKCVVTTTFTRFRVRNK